MYVCLQQGQKHVGPVKSRKKTRVKKEGKKETMKAAEQTRSSRTENIEHPQKIREQKYREGLEAT